MKTSLFYFLIFSLTILLGCGGGGFIAEQQAEQASTTGIPNEGILLIGQGLRDESVTYSLSGGNSGTFTGLNNQSLVSGSYNYQFNEGVTQGVLTLDYEDALNFEDAQETITLIITDLENFSGNYSGTWILTFAGFDDGDTGSSNGTFVKRSSTTE